MRIQAELEIPLEYKNMRLDSALAKCLPDYSRSQITQWIKNGTVLVDQKRTVPKLKIQGEEKIVIDAEVNQIDDCPEEKPLDIVFEDEHILVINKPANLVVHPGAGNWTGTLLNALLFHSPNLKNLPRAGIIHRLDKDTTGLMVVTKSQAANLKLIDDLKDRKITRRYYAVVKGNMIGGGTIDRPIGRHPRNRLKMAVHHLGKPAVTHYKIKQRFTGYTWLDIRLESGRTHQIRVHFTHKHAPLVGDPLYKGRGQLSANLSDHARKAVQSFTRPALHAYHLALTHPVTQEPLSWTQPLPEDMCQLIKDLQDENNTGPLAST